MKIKYVLVAALMMSISAFAQKDELKALKKLDSKIESTMNAQKPPVAADIQEYKRLLDETEPKISAAPDDQKADFYYYKGSYAFLEMFTNPAKAQTAFFSMKENYDKVLELEKKGKQKYTKEILEETYPEVKTQIVNMATEIANKQTKESSAMAAAYYYAAYQLVPAEQGNLFNAAVSALNGGDYQKALDYYIELDKTGWTGEGKVFTAVDKKSGEVEPFPNEASRDIAVKTGQYISPSIQEYKSQKPEIASKIGILYAELGQNDKAKEALAKARKLNPDDISLIVAEANIYYKINDIAGYKKLINEAIAKNPNSPELFYNLGIVSTATDAKEAEGYFKKVTELKADHFDAWVRLGDLMLVDEQKLTDQMNALGSTAADNKKYEALKKQKDANYHSAVGYYEKAHALKADDQYVISMLTSLYQAVEMTDKYNAMKAKKKQ
ncbi:MAG: tetratricopeptide repeat protein [Bacteroidota bacterium]